ncbi:uncharacterized protein BT62DRAFT_935414 [Guyanagaster necrorhizus]|uniref:NudC domain-containing protein 1 n=1 Tax=Guyanagaster necrorhizus TaxID=856835 RepID=A0A9P8AP92_9AGAR|nr:uncharacterized protein BT62DRAFT_935414 [Guyanagaster necrorhizus MCA 3950]KAG7443088.1 hypothetical protein BT62DRAFT_935414 [Guyanagaster necrorhizus MCA 3950]
MASFHLQKALINPQFEGYKLHSISQNGSVTRYNLEHKATQVTSSNKSLLTFKEMQSRISHNHLATCEKYAVYVDSQFNLIAIFLAPETNQPNFRVVFEIPHSLESASVETHRNEYPSAAFLSSSVVLLADGSGSLYVLRTTERGPFELISFYQLPSSPGLPFRIHSVEFRSPDTVLAILSSRNYADGNGAPVAKKHGHIDFDVWAVKLDVLNVVSSDVQTMNVVWQRRGDDVPTYVTYVPSRQCHLLVGGSVYRNIGTGPLPSYSPMPDEIVPIPRAEENFDSAENGPTKPPPYSWYQTTDSLTIAFPLPYTTPKSNIHIEFSLHSVTLHIHGEALEAIPFPDYHNEAFWGGIDSSSCLWTWDREAEHSFGLLTLHLEKQHEGTRWMRVFKNNTIDVPETLDPSELYKIREALEKYTATLRDGEDISGLGLGRGVPSFAGGEIDEEVDGSVGQQAYLTWVGIDGYSPSWASGSHEIPIRLLSTPLPGSATPIVSLITKESVDGTVFTLGSEDISEWIHTSTFSALAFVLASKRDTRFIYHTNAAVLAFESGAQNRGANVYIYRAVPPMEKWAKQAILKVNDGVGGSLLGVGAIETQEGRQMVICLAENELVTIKDI